MCKSSASGCTFPYFIVQYCRVQYLYFKLHLQEDSCTKPLAMQQEELTNEDLMELEAQRKDEERQEEKVTEESKRSTMQEVARGFSLFEEGLLILRYRT